MNQDLTVRAQNEPAAAVNPNNPLHMVAAWCDNRLFYFDWNLRKTDLAYGVTFDGGQTWQSQRIEFAAIPAGALTADPSVVIDTSGNVSSASCVTVPTTGRTPRSTRSSWPGRPTAD